MTALSIFKHETVSWASMCCAKIPMLEEFANAGETVKVRIFGLRFMIVNQYSGDISVQPWSFVKQSLQNANHFLQQ